VPNERRSPSTRNSNNLSEHSGANTAAIARSGCSAPNNEDSHPRATTPARPELRASGSKPKEVSRIGPMTGPAKQSMEQQQEEWIASSRSLSSGAHSRDPLAPLRERFAFVAGDDDQTQLRHLAAHFARVLPVNFDPLQLEGAGNAGRPLRPQPRVVCRKHTR
jgi:hypothetical protein